MSQNIKKPLVSLQKAINKRVIIRLKSDIEYKGKMCNVDSYMNMILVNAEEYSSGTLLTHYGKVVIRGNNVLFVQVEDNL